MPMLATYWIVDGHVVRPRVRPACATRPPTTTGSTSFAQGIGAYRAVLFLEMDSMITCRLPLAARAGRPDARSSTTRSTSSRELPAPGRVPRCRRRRRAVRRDAAQATCASAGRRGDPGLLPQRHPLRLDLARDPLRRADLAPDRRQALRRQHRRERPGSAAARDIVHARQRGAVQPARARPWAEADVQHRLPATSTCSRGPATPASPAGSCRPGRAADRRVLARVRVDAGPATPTSTSAETWSTSW